MSSAGSRRGSVEGGVRSDLPSDGGRTPRPNSASGEMIEPRKMTPEDWRDRIASMPEDRPREVALSDRTVDDEPERWKRDLIADGIAEAERRQRPPYHEPVCPWCSVFILEGEDRTRYGGRWFHKGCAEDMLTRDSDVERE